MIMRWPEAGLSGKSWGEAQVPEAWDFAAHRPLLRPAIPRQQHRHQNDCQRQGKAVGGNQTIGTGEYDTRHGGLDLNKFGHTEAKVRPVLRRLFGKEES